MTQTITPSTGQKGLGTTVSGVQCQRCAYLCVYVCMCVCVCVRAAAVGKLPAPRDLFQSLHHHLICSDSHLMHAHTSSLHATNRQPTASTAASLAAAAALESSALSEVESMQLLCVRAMTEVSPWRPCMIAPVLCDPMITHPLASYS